MDDYKKLQICFNALVSTDALNRIHNRICSDGFSLSVETALRHVHYDRNPLHYIVTSQLTNDTVAHIFKTLSQDDNCLRHRDQVYGRYPIHYAAASAKYNIRNPYYDTLFLIELGRRCYCGFEDVDQVYSKSVKDYLCGTKLLAVIIKMYDKVAYKIQKMYKRKTWYRRIKEIELLPPNGCFCGGIEFQRLQHQFGKLQ